MYLLVDNNRKTTAQLAAEADDAVPASAITAAIHEAFASLQQRDPAFALAQRRVLNTIARGDLAAAVRDAIVLAGSYAQTQASLDTATHLPPQYLMAFFASPAD